MDKYRKFTFDILMIVRDNPAYTKRIREAQKQLGMLIADRVINNQIVLPQLAYAYKYFRERAYL